MKLEMLIYVVIYLKYCLNAWEIFNSHVSDYIVYFLQN